MFLPFWAELDYCQLCTCWSVLVQVDSKYLTPRCECPSQFRDIPLTLVMKYGISRQLRQERPQLAVCHHPGASGGGGAGRADAARSLGGELLDPKGCLRRAQVSLLGSEGVLAYQVYTLVRVWGLHWVARGRADQSLRVLLAGKCSTCLRFGILGALQVVAPACSGLPGRWPGGG